MNDGKREARATCQGTDCARHGLRAIDAQSLQLFGRDNGENSMVIVLEAELDRDVDAAALGEAVALAEQRFKSFGCGLASTGRGLCYRELTTPPRAFADVEGRRWRLGTPETDGRLYRVTYDGPRVTVSLHHGLTDGRGAFEYLKVLLYHYLIVSGHHVDPEGKVLLSGEVPTTEDDYPCETYGDASLKVEPPAQSEAKFLGIPEDYLDERGEYLCRHFEIAMPVDSVVSESRTAGVTVTSLVVAAVDGAIASAYHPSDEIVLTCVTTDLRPFFQTTTVQNFSGYTILAEVPAMRAIGMEAEAAALAQQLAAARDRGAALARLAEYRADAARMRETPTDELFGNEERRMQEKRGVRSRLACMVTNVGVVDLPTDVARHVRRASFHIPSFNATMTIAVCTVGGMLTMSITQPFESEGFVRALEETLCELHIPAHLTDKGLEAFDVLGRDAVSSVSSSSAQSDR